MHRTRFTPVTGLGEVGPDNDRVLLSDATCFIVRGRADLVAVAPHEGRELWIRPHEQPAPEFYRVPRRVRASGRLLWSNGHVVAYVLDVEDGVRVEAADARSGTLLWTRDFATPPPLEWTEPSPAWPGANTEEISAFLADEQALVLAIHRSSRRTLRWPDIPAPPQRSRIELHRIDEATGTVAWSTQLDEVVLPILEQSGLRLQLRAAGGIACIDAVSGDIEHRPLARKNLGWPRAIGSRLYAPWYERGRAGIDRLGPGSTIDSVEWPRKRVQTVRLHAFDSERCAFQANEQFLSIIGRDFAALPEQRTPTWIYDIKQVGDALVVATTGAHGGAYCQSLHDGSALGHAPIPGGTWSIHPFGETPGIALCTRAGLVLWSPHARSATSLLDARVPILIAGKLDHGIVSVCRGADAGVLFIEP